MLPKVLIVVVAFPLFAHVIFTITRVGLGYLLPSLPPLSEATMELFQRSSVGVAVLIGVVASFKICRRLWPTPAVKQG